MRLVSQVALAALRTLSIALLMGVVLVGCTEVDPIEAILEQHEAGDFAGSIESLRELMLTRGDDAQVNYLYGMALVMTQQPTLAVWSLRKAMKDPEWLLPAGSQLAFVALAARDFNEVIEITGLILAREPDHLSSLLMRANAQAHWKKDPELALADARRVLDLDPEALEAYEPLILALLSLERLEEAREALAEAGRRLVARDDKVHEGILAWHCSTTAAFEQASGDLEQARKTWSRCLTAHPTSLEVVSNAIAFYDSLGELEQAREILEAAVDGAPNSRVLRIALAQWLRHRGEAAAAEAVLREATLSENPHLAAAAWVDLAKHRQALAEHGAAADAMERAVELLQETNGASPQLLFECADSLVLAGRFARALELAEDLPVPAHRHLIQGRVAQERRDPAQALEEFGEAIRLWPDNPWARYYTALAAEELGDFEQALEEYRFAVRISPGATDARKRGADLLLATGNPRAALQMLVVGRDEAPLDIEGELLFVRLSGVFGDMSAIAGALGRLEQSHPAWVGRALVEAAEGLTTRAGPIVALSMLATAPNVDFRDLRYASALRARVRLAHEVSDTPAAQSVLASALEAHPDSADLQAIRGLDLELSGAPEAAVRDAYGRALELAAENAYALAGLGRLALADEPETALGLFDRAAVEDPSDPRVKLQAVAALRASGGKPDELLWRLQRLLLSHPYEIAAATQSAQLDLDRGVATPETLERAKRAVRFGGGPEALELLARVYRERGEAEPAARAVEQARALREALASDG